MKLISSFQVMAVPGVLALFSSQKKNPILVRSEMQLIQVGRRCCDDFALYRNEFMASSSTLGIFGVFFPRLALGDLHSRAADELRP